MANECCSFAVGWGGKNMVLSNAKIFSINWQKMRLGSNLLCWRPCSTISNLRFENPRFDSLTSNFSNFSPLILCLSIATVNLYHWWGSLMVRFIFLECGIWYCYHPKTCDSSIDLAFDSSASFILLPPSLCTLFYTPPVLPCLSVPWSWS